MSKPDWAARLQRTFQRKYEAGVQAERERIVKLLEDNKWRDEVVFNYIIALIKGENK